MNERKKKFTVRITNSNKKKDNWRTTKMKKIRAGATKSRKRKTKTKFKKQVDQGNEPEREIKTGWKKRPAFISAFKKCAFLLQRTGARWIASQENGNKTNNNKQKTLTSVSPLRHLFVLKCLFFFLFQLHVYFYVFFVLSFINIIFDNFSCWGKKRRV